MTLVLTRLFNDIIPLQGAQGVQSTRTHWLLSREAHSWVRGPPRAFLNLAQRGMRRVWDMRQTNCRSADKGYKQSDW